MAALALIGMSSRAEAERLPRSVRSAWRTAGAVVEDGKDYPVAAVSFRERPAQGFAKLPATEVPIHLELHATKLTEDDFKALAALKSVRSLTLSGGITTPPGDVSLKGLKALSTLTELHLLTLETLNATDAAYEEVAALGQVRELSLNRSRQSDAALIQVGRMPALEVFRSNNGYGESCEARGVTHLGVKGLAAAPRLREVELVWFPIDDAGFQHIARAKELESLRVFATHQHEVTVSDEGHLAGATNLKSLSFTVSRSRLTDDGVKHLAGLSQLNRLALRYAEVTDEGMRTIAGLTKLEQLDLSATAITNAGVERLRELTSLTYLDLRGNSCLTAAGFGSLSELKRLRTLELVGTKMFGTPAREARLAEFRKAVPECEIGMTIDYGDP